MPPPFLIQLPLPTLDGLAYPRGADGLIHQCAWCRRVLGRARRFRLLADEIGGGVPPGMLSRWGPPLPPVTLAAADRPAGGGPAPRMRPSPQPSGRLGT